MSVEDMAGLLDVAIVGGPESTDLQRLLAERLVVKGVRPDKIKTYAPDDRIDSAKQTVYLVSSRRLLEGTDPMRTGIDLVATSKALIAMARHLTNTALLIDVEGFDKNALIAKARFGSKHAATDDAFWETTTTRRLGMLCKDYLPSALVEESATAMADSIVLRLNNVVDRQVNFRRSFVDRLSVPSKCKFSVFLGGAIGEIGNWRETFVDHLGLVAKNKEIDFDVSSAFNPVRKDWNEKAFANEERAKLESLFQLFHLADRRGHDDPNFSRSGLSAYSVLEATLAHVLSPLRTISTVDLASYEANVRHTREMAAKNPSPKAVAVVKRVEEEHQVMRQIVSLWLKEFSQIAKMVLLNHPWCLSRWMMLRP